MLEVSTGGGVIVVGSVNVDLVTSVPRLPAPGETVIGDAFRQCGGGKGANQAVAAARLGARTWLVGATGADPFGELARAELVATGVDVTYLAVSSEPTGIAQILVDQHGENLIGVAPGANAQLDVRHVRDALEEIARPGWVVVANLEIPDPAVEVAAETASACGARFILNPAPARPLSRALLARCHVLTPNEHEVDVLCLAIGASTRPNALLEAGVDNVIVTRGAHGADLFRRDEVYHQPAFPAAPVDTTGAGDAFTGALAWGLAEGMDEHEALRAAAAAGALATRAIGARTALPSRGELTDFLAPGLATPS